MQAADEGECRHRRVFVGGVPIKMSEDVLREYFSRFGPVAFFKLGRNKKTQDPLGFAFVEFEKESDYRAVLGQKHFIQGREIDVKPFADEGEVDRNNRQTLQRKVHVKGIPISCTQRELIEAFSKYGRIERGFIMYNHKTGCSRGFGFVEFTDPLQALKVISQTVTVGESQVEVSMAVERAKGKKAADGKAAEATTNSEAMPCASTTTTLIPRRAHLKISDLDDCGSQVDRKGSSIDGSPVQNVLSTLSVTPILPANRRGRSPGSFVFRYENTPEPKHLNAQGPIRSDLRSRLQGKCTKPCKETDGDLTRVEKSGTSQDSSTRPPAEEVEPVMQTFKQRLASLTSACRDNQHPQYRFKVGSVAPHLFKHQYRV